jgi:hypothetical protein
MTLLCEQGCASQTSLGDGCVVALTGDKVGDLLGLEDTGIEFSGCVAPTVGAMVGINHSKDEGSAEGTSVDDDVGI